MERGAGLPGGRHSRGAAPRGEGGSRGSGHEGGLRPRGDADLPRAGAEGQPGAAGALLAGGAVVAALREVLPHRVMRVFRCSGERPAGQRGAGLRSGVVVRVCGRRGATQRGAHSAQEFLLRHEAKGDKASNAHKDAGMTLIYLLKREQTRRLVCLNSWAAVLHRNRTPNVPWTSSRTPHLRGHPPALPVAPAEGDMALLPDPAP